MKTIKQQNEYNKKIKHYNNEMQRIKEKQGINLNDLSDGYHTFGELYKHRIHLFIALCKSLNRNYTIIKSWIHNDGSSFEGWFIIQIEHKYVGQISYHLPKEYWDKCNFIKTLDKANKWDGHTSNDVLDRLLLI